MWNTTKLHAKPWSVFIVISFLDLIFPTPLTAFFMCSLAGNSVLGLGKPDASTELWTTRDVPYRAAKHPPQSRPACFSQAGRGLPGRWAMSSTQPQPHSGGGGPAAARAEHRGQQVATVRGGVALETAPAICSGPAAAAKRCRGAQLSAGAHAEPSAPPYALICLLPTPPGWVSSPFRGIIRFYRECCSSAWCARIHCQSDTSWEKLVLEQNLVFKKFLPTQKQAPPLHCTEQLSSELQTCRANYDFP